MLNLLVNSLLFVTILSSVLLNTVATTEQEARSALLRKKYLYPNYPTEIPHYPVRANPYNLSEPVSRGRFHLIGGIPYTRDKSKQVPLDTFKQALQCSASEPTLDELYGTLSLLELFPPTKETVELFCTWAETHCYGADGDWTGCKKKRQEFKEGKYPDKFYALEHTPFQRSRLLRIINGDLFYDWPWGMDRVFPFRGYSKVYYPLVYALNAINDIKDSVFAFGGEIPKIPWKLPFPLIAEAGHFAESNSGTNSILWPWEAEFSNEEQLYRKMQAVKGDFSDVAFRKLLHTLPWEQKHNKAAFYASYDASRLVLMEQTARHPELFDFQVYFIFLYCWTPACTEFRWNISDTPSMQAVDQSPISQNLSGVALHKYKSTGGRYNPGHFKYIVVPLGANGKSTSSRLLYLLAHCDCVLLFTQSHLHYHISLQLRPWVHYVPISYSGADVVAKVQWLQEHDDLARQIAINGRNFGASYLRMEDYLCYSATVLSALGDVMAGTSALEVFQPVNITGLPFINAIGQP